MSCPLRRCLILRCGALLGIVFLTAANASAADLFHAASPQPSAAEQKIEAALDDDTTFKFTKTPLSDVVAYLQDLHQVNIRLDSKALAAARIGTDARISRNLSGVSLRSAMRMLLNDLDLTYVVHDEVLLISTPEAAEKMVTVRVYDVAALLEMDDTADELARILAGTLSGRKLVVGTDARGASSGSDLSATVTSETHRSIAAFRQLLIVRDTMTGHREVAEILTSLRDALSP